MVGGSS